MSLKKTEFTKFQVSLIEWVKHTAECMITIEPENTNVLSHAI